MGTAPPQAEVRTVAGRPGTWRPPVSRAGCLAICAYLAVAVALNWRLWAGLGTMSPAGDPGPADNDLMAWFMRYTADAIAHGHLPALVTTALNAPRGISLMWNAAMPLPMAALAPVTLLAGPQASLTILVTLGYGGSAAAMYWLLRGHGATPAAAWLGGAVYGFSPGMVNAGIAHYQLQFAVLPPLIVGAVLRIVTGRGNPVAAGAWLALLAAAQLFTGEEMLAETAIGCLVLVVALGASRPPAVRARLARAGLGLGTAAVVTALVCGYALWTQLHGPLAQHGSPWPIAKFGNSLGGFVNPQAGLVFHTASSAAYAASHGASSAEYVAYLGPPLLILVAAVTVWYWRDPRVRSAGVVWAVLEATSLGATSPLLPFHWLQGLPLLGQMLPDRLSILADGAAAAVLAFGLDLARARTPSTAGPLRTAAPVAVAVLAILPLLPRPAAAAPGTPLPAGWAAVMARLDTSPGAGVLVVPVPYSHQSAAMRWQADTGQPGSLVGGWFIGPGPSGRATTQYWGPPATTRAVHCLDALWSGAAAGSGCGKAVLSALAYWHPAAVVADTGPGTVLGRALRKLLGKPAIQDGQLLAWRR